MCVRMCLLSSEGLSNALPHTSHGSSVLSPRGGRDLGDGWRRAAQASWRSVSSRSPAEDAAEDSDSPDTDLRSSVSPVLGGDDEFEMSTRDRSDMDRSSGESATEYDSLHCATCLGPSKFTYHCSCFLSFSLSLCYFLFCVLRVTVF